MRKAFLAVILCLLSASLPLCAADGPDAMGPELAPPSAPAAAEHPQQADITFINKLIAQYVAHGDGSSPDVTNLRRIRTLLQKAPSQKETSAALSLSDLRGRLLTELQKRVAASRASRLSRETLAMYQIFLDDPENALETLRKTGPASGRDIYHPLRLAYTYLRLGDYEKGYDALQRVESLLSGHLPLTLTKPVLCESITAYRIYDPRPDLPIRAGERTFVYVEVQGAGFRQQSPDEAACNIQFGLEIRNELQTVVWEEPDYGSWAQTYRGRVSEIHVSVTFRIPNTLQPGRHYLIINAHDRISDRRGSASLPFDFGRRTRQPTDDENIDTKTNLSTRTPVPPSRDELREAMEAADERTRKTTEIIRRHANPLRTLDDDEDPLFE